MTIILELLFAAAMIIVLYTYIGYGAMLWLLVKWKQRRSRTV